MLKILNFILDFLRDKNDGSSYKRITGFGCFVVAVIIAFTTKDVSLCGLFLGVSLGEGVATLFEKKDV